MLIWSLLLNYIDAIYGQIVFPAALAVITLATPFMWLAVAAWVAVRGMQLFYAEVTGSRMMWESVGLVLIVAFVTNSAMFDEYVVNALFYGMPQALAQVAASIIQQGPNIALPGTVGQQLNVMMAEVFKAVGQAYQAIGFDFTSIGLVIFMCLALIAAIVGCGAAALIYVIGKFFLLVVIILGALFIGCAMFRFTRGFFDRWFGKCISLVLLQTMALIVVAVDGSANTMIMQKVVSGPGLNADPLGMLAQLATIIVLFLLGGFMIYLLPSFAYSLGAGIQTTFIPPLPGSRDNSGKEGGRQPAYNPDIRLGMNPAAMQGAAPSQGGYLPPPRNSTPPSAPTPFND